MAEFQPKIIPACSLLDNGTVAMLHLFSSFFFPRHRRKFPPCRRVEEEEEGGGGGGGVL